MDNESEAERIQSFVDSGNYHAAINIAISALNECRRNDDQTGSDKFLRIINNISKTMAREFGSQTFIDEITNK